MSRAQPEISAAPETLSAVNRVIPLPWKNDSTSRSVRSARKPAPITNTQTYGTWKRNTRKASAAASTGAPVSVS